MLEDGGEGGDCDGGSGSEESWRGGRGGGRGGVGSGAHTLQSLTGRCRDSGCCSQKNGESLQACKQKILSLCILLDTHKRMLYKNNYSLGSPQYLVPGRCSVNICRMDE